jgi:hypothetical protein
MPVPTPNSVTEPLAHLVQLLPDVAYQPALHAMQAAVEAMLDCPAVHAVHVDAPLVTMPVPAPNSAIQPAAHLAQRLPDAAYQPVPQAVQTEVETTLDCPAVHAVHVEAPLVTMPPPIPDSAIEPAAHCAQATVGEDEYIPRSHAVQFVAPLLTTFRVR